MEFQGDFEILQVIANAGCAVDKSRVGCAPGFCRQTIQATAPRQFTQHARNPTNKRHMDMFYAHIRHSDRAFMGAFIGAERAGHLIDMACILFGADFAAQNAVLYRVSNTNAPLVMDAHMSGALKNYAQPGQPVACTPWVLTGAMAPTTAAGTLAQVLTEVLAALTLVQLIAPGASCLMGSFASTMWMKSGAPAFGSPEAGLMVLAAG